MDIPSAQSTSSPKNVNGNEEELRGGSEQCESSSESNNLTIQKPHSGAVGDGVTVPKTSAESTGKPEGDQEGPTRKAYDDACENVDALIESLKNKFRQLGETSESLMESLTTIGYWLQTPRLQRYQVIAFFLKYHLLRIEAIQMSAELRSLRKLQLSDSGRMSVFGAVQQCEMEKFDLKEPLPTREMEKRRQMWSDFLKGPAMGTQLGATLQRLGEADIEEIPIIIARLVEKSERIMKENPEKYPLHININQRRVSAEHPQPYFVTLYQGVLDIDEVWTVCAILFDMHVLVGFGDFAEKDPTFFEPNPEDKRIRAALHPWPLPLFHSEKIKYIEEEGLQNLDFMNLQPVEQFRSVCQDYFPPEVCQSEFFPILDDLEEAVLKENQTFIAWAEQERANYNVMITLYQKYKKDLDNLQMGIVMADMVHLLSAIGRQVE